MRPQFIILVLLLVAVILAVVFLLRPIQHHAAHVTNEETIQSNVAAASASATDHNASAMAQPLTATNADSKAKKMSLPELVEKAIEKNNTPIDFYGEVIDQDSNVLSGVEIKAAIRHWTMMDPSVVEYGLGSKEIPIERVTGLDGRFEIHDVSGDAFGVVVTKNGYDAEPGSRGFGGGISGSLENPIIFKMWSTNIHEQLITGGKSFHMVPDGRPYFINLADDTISESSPGDLKVWIQYTNQVKNSQFYDWSAGIEVINGGLLEQPIGTPMFQAPMEGYVPGFQLQQKIKGYQGGELGSRQFYLSLKDGREYGQMTINLLAPYNFGIPGLIRLSYAINPSGSRILR